VTDGGAAAVVFDLDGVLIDSERLWDEVRRELTAAAGRPWPPQASRAMLGMSTSEWSRYLTDVVGIPGPPDRVAAEVIDRMTERYRTRLPLVPGAVPAVRRLGERFPLGLASSAPRRVIDAVLSAAGLAGEFRVTVSTEEVAAGKPSPAVYQEAVRRLGVPAADAAAIEDSGNGLRSAAAAGLAVIAVPNHDFPPAGDELALAAVVVRGLDELTPELVSAAVEGARRGMRSQPAHPPEA
jgi:HAD superfamily hydrolase (TIGR01509 family)